MPDRETALGAGFSPAPAKAGRATKIEARTAATAPAERQCLTISMRSSFKGTNDLHPEHAPRAAARRAGRDTRPRRRDAVRPPSALDPDQRRQQIRVDAVPGGGARDGGEGILLRCKHAAGPAARVGRQGLRLVRKMSGAEQART